MQNTPGDDAEEGQQPNRADEAELFSYRGKDKVGLLFGHVAQVRLGPMAKDVVPFTVEVQRWPQRVQAAA